MVWGEVHPRMQGRTGLRDILHGGVRPPCSSLVLSLPTPLYSASSASQEHTSQPPSRTSPLSRPLLSFIPSTRGAQGCASYAQPGFPFAEVSDSAEAPSHLPGDAAPSHRRKNPIPECSVFSFYFFAVSCIQRSVYDHFSFLIK